MNFTRLFIDTAYVLALINPRDVYHKKALELLPDIHKACEVLITESVLT